MNIHHTGAKEHVYNFQEEIDELRATERRGSNEYYYQVTLVAICISLACFFLGDWILLGWFVLVYGLSSIERSLHRRSPQPYSKCLFITYLILGTGIACAASLLPVYLWTFDERIYHFAALVYTVGAVLNTFAVRTQAWPALLCNAIPNGLAMCAVAIMFVIEDGLTMVTAIGLILACVITAYLAIVVRESVRKVRLSRETTKALLQAQKSETVANFAGGVAHDFNNLLGVIQASLEQANDETDDAERRNLIDQAIAAVGRGSGLTKQLLAVGRQTELDTKEIDMASFTAELKQFLTRIIPSSVVLEFSCDATLKSIRSEPTLLQSMLLNLAMNARDAMADFGKIKISIDRVEITETQTVSAGYLVPGTYAKFCVEDDGKGMNSEIFGRVLEPFFSTRPVGEGTGLGLAMVSGFSQQVGGALDIASLETVGTTVSFYLPLVDERSAASAATKPDQVARAPRKIEGLNLLLVEDETALNTMLNRYLTKKGFNVRSYENGDLAFEAVRDGYEADVVLTDLVMPGSRQGTDLVADIKKTIPDAAVIMMTGYAFNHDTSAFSSSLAANTSVLEKPFKLSELDRLLEAVLHYEDG